MASVYSSIALSDCPEFIADNSGCEPKGQPLHALIAYQPIMTSGSTIVSHGFLELPKIPVRVRSKEDSARPRREARLVCVSLRSGANQLIPNTDCFIE